MVTGVPFLVPVSREPAFVDSFLTKPGLSAAGGIMGDGNSIDIGGMMIALTIGVTVGLFMSQAIGYSESHYSCFLRIDVSMFVCVQKVMYECIFIL